jgi:hypothetical protein
MSWGIHRAFVTSRVELDFVSTTPVIERSWRLPAAACS